MANERIKKLELTWTGKDAQISPEPRILLEQKDKAYGDPDSENMLIHGDNLLALKSLEDEFAGQVKCIYIDPPYNTGSAFEQYDDGVEHSIWLSLIRDRLEILRNLLADNGSIWISIDDNECDYLKILCDEIFGRSNFVARVSWHRNYASTNDSKTFAKVVDYILVYQKTAAFKRNLLPRTEKQDSLYKYDSNDGRGKWRSDNLSVKTYSKSYDYPIINPNTGVSYSPPKGRSWMSNVDAIQRWIKEGRIFFGQKGDGAPQLKRYLNEVQGGVVPITYWSYDEVGHNDEARKEIKALFSENLFATPKPERLIERVLTLGSNKGDLVLDSFLGSGTTAAVAHKMGRRWIGIELGDHAYTHCIPRLQKVVDGTDQGGISKSVGWTGGGGFKFYELASSLIVKDMRGFDIISKEYNGDMLAEAMCKIMGYKYRPDKAVFWKQGKGTENNWLFTTTMTLTEEYLEEIHEELGGESLLVCCGGFTGSKNAFNNITIKRIPKAILEKCEWNKPGYPLPVKEDFSEQDFEIEEVE